MGNCFGCDSECFEKCVSCYQSCCGDEETVCDHDCLRDAFELQRDGKSKKPICVAVFLSIIGILLIAEGVVVGYYPEKVDAIFFYVEDVTKHEFVPKYQLMIAIGVFLCISATCACCCGYFLTISAGSLLVSFIMVIVVVGLVGHSVNTFDSGSLKAEIKKDLVAKIDSNTTADSIWVHIQQNLKCCGIEGPSD